MAIGGMRRDWKGEAEHADCFDYALPRDSDPKQAQGNTMEDSTLAAAPLLPTWLGCYGSVYGCYGLKANFDFRGKCYGCYGCYGLQKVVLVCYTSC
jgi:hypothetical protein